VGAGSVRTLIKEAGRLGIEYLTLYSFSTENWKRPADEISELMRLYVDYLAGERDMLSEHNIRLRQIGRRDGLPAECLRALDATLDATAGNTGPTLTLAVNYSGRAEITDAVRAIARQAAAGEIDPADIDERTVERHLYTAGIPDPDLLVRTAGELRVSNYLLWQISYTELFVTETLWPDFQQTDLHAAVRAYAKRSRRFGATEASDATV
jgi:undecaprenyl diphosphate synthase